MPHQPRWVAPRWRRELPDGEADGDGRPTRPIVPRTPALAKPQGLWRARDLGGPRRSLTRKLRSYNRRRRNFESNLTFRDGLAGVALVPLAPQRNDSAPDLHICPSLVVNIHRRSEWWRSATLTAGPCASLPSSRQSATACLVGLGRSPVRFQGMPTSVSGDAHLAVSCSVSWSNAARLVAELVWKECLESASGLASKCR